ncbi:MAG: glucose-6-phosphate dehydrogenase [Hyphomicrobiales bacterium]
MVSKVIPVNSFDLIIFGATGDLAKRKIFPSLFRRFVAGQMTNESRVIGAARSEMNAKVFRKYMKDALVEFCADCCKDKDVVDAFLDLLSYVKVDAVSGDGMSALKKTLRDDVIRVFYLSVAPSLYKPIAKQLHDSGVSTPDSRIVAEKPFGNSLPTARELNQELRNYFEEKQIYRIDHYLGKETVQNLMALRFANALFERSWNSTNIDHVQITVAEDLGVEGRGGYYDQSGAMRDMVQNHLMQLLCLIAMEPPSKFESDAVRDEKLKIIRALDPVQPENVVRGQYRDSDTGIGYLEHSENPESRTECFIAIKAHISNWRWAGTPFYLRTGKKMRNRKSEIAVVFRNPPHSIFDQKKDLQGNDLIIRLQPDEGITLKMTIKEPGPGGMRLAEVPMDMTFAETLGQVDQAPDAYERLIMDVVRGDQTLFMRDDEVEAAWEWIDPIMKQWEEAQDKPLAYDSGGSGPEEAMIMMHQDGRRWRSV